MLVLKLSDPDGVRPSVARKIDADDDIEPANGSHGRREHVVQLMLATAVLGGLSACGAQIGAVRPEKMANMFEFSSRIFTMVRAMRPSQWHEVPTSPAAAHSALFLSFAKHVAFTITPPYQR